METSSKVSTRASIETLQIGRAFAALAVVLFHVETTLGLPKYLGREIFPVFEPGEAGVYYFFVLSGFVMVTAHARDLGRSDVVLPFLWKRFRRIYPALWVVLASQAALFLMIPQDRIAAAELPWIMLKDFMILPWGGPSLLSVEWTLRHEVLFYIAFAIILLAPERRWVITGAAIAAIAIGQFVTMPAPLDRVVSGYNLLFGFGVAAALLYRRDAVANPRAVLTLGLAVFVSNWAALAVGLYDKSMLVIWAYGIGAALIIVGAAALERGSGFAAPLFVRLLGDASYAIYLAHYPVVSALCKFLTRLQAHIPFPDWLVFTIVFVAAVAAGLAFHILIERPLMAWLPTRFHASGIRPNRPRLRS
ncbi:acyltransferase [Rhodopseudomonas palustris]|uniref:acyltransferase family protein n=1 Tax=Rhodopseudomonas palustris TaxID=1076 RepID=UPI0020CF90B4|nr:acyltransferase [Rhodopseudomonas palustris]MCP9626306.1 acyltransferase [Rhodopseudomonas palustris]